MRENGILFSAPMVRAILAGTKTQTRRVVGLSELRRSETPGYDWTWRGQAPIRSVAQQQRYPGGCWQDVSDERLLALCPHGAPGDRLWVRETFSPHRGSSEPASIADAEYVVLRDGAHAIRRSGEVIPGLPTYADGAFDHIRWRPSIHMPRWASRLTLEITSVRVERLTAISEEDARAEGVTPCSRCHGTGIDPVRVGHDPDWCSECGGGSQGTTHRDAFERLWDALNGERPGRAWRDDPWVWVIGFRRVEGA